MSKRLESQKVFFTVLFALALMTGVAHSASSSASYFIPHDTLDAGGGRAQSASYAVESTFASFGGLSAAPTSAAVTRIGFAGQLNDRPVAANKQLTISRSSPSAINLSAFDADGDALSFRVVSGPANGVLTGTAPSLVYSPSVSFASNDQFTFVASDSIADSTLATVTLLAAAGVNAPPRFEPILDRAVNEGQALTSVLRASDPDLPPQNLTLSFGSGAPAGASLDPDTGLFTWTPNEAQGPGNYLVSIRVTDSGNPPLNASAQFNIVVHEVNQPPSLAPLGDIVIPPGVQTSFQIFASDPDLPAQQIVFALGAGAPAGAALDRNTGAFLWTPGFESVGQRFVLTVTATDNGSPALSTSHAFAITVEAPPPPTNTAPVLAAISEKSAQVGNLLTFQVTATDTESPPQQIAFSLGTGAPVGSALDSNTGLFAWTPSPETAGQRFVVTVIATDNGSPRLSASRTFSITVAAAPPQNTPPNLAVINDTLVRPSDVVTFTANAFDADLPPQRLTFSLGAGAPAGARIEPTSGVFTWVLSQSQGPGQFSITIIVTDDGTPPLSASRTFRVQVPGPNTPPILALIEDEIVEQGRTLSFPFLAADRDLPAQKLSYALELGAPEGARLDMETLTFSWTPSEAQGPGSYRITVRATDDGQPALSVARSFTVTVTDVNLPPVLAPISDQTARVGATLSFIARATDPDLPAQTLTFALADGPSGAAIEATSGLFTWRPPANEPAGQVFARIIVRDNGTPTATAAQTVRINVVTGPSPAPSVRLIEPSDGASVTLPAVIRLAAIAQDFATPPRRVEFLADDVILGEGAIAPFEFSWQHAIPGRRRLIARAVAVDGSIVASPSVEIVVIPSRRILQPTLTTQNEIQFVYEGMPNACYRAESTSDFQRWMPFLSGSADATGRFVVIARRDQTTSTFYRVVEISCGAAPPIEMSHAKVSASGEMSFTIRGSPNTCYTIETTSDFLTWQQVSVQKTDAAGNSVITALIDRTSGFAFYRAVETSCSAAPPIEMSHPKVSASGEMSFTIRGSPNTCYTIETTSDFLTWQQVSVQKTDTAGNSVITTTIDMTLGFAFFRARPTECAGR